MFTACVLLDIEPIQMPAFLTDVLTLDINKGKQLQSTLSLSQTHLGPALAVRLREMSVV